jgi:hypothetical protein
VIDRPLPFELLTFLRVSRNEVFELKQPSWIRGPMDGESLLIDFSSKASKNGLRKESFTLKRRLFVAENANALSRLQIEKQVLMLLIGYVDGCITTSRTKSSIVPFWSTACHLGEFWLNSDLAAESPGDLASVDGDVILDFLESYKNFGIEGVLELGRIWDEKLTLELQCLGDAGLNDLCAGRDEVFEQKINTSMERADSLGVPPGEAEFLRKAIRFLLGSNAYDAAGNVDSKFAGALLNIPPKRIVSNARFLYHLRRFSLADSFSKSDFPIYGVRSEKNHLRRSIEQRVAVTGNYKVVDKIRALRHISAAARSLPMLTDSDLANRDLLEEVFSIVDQLDGGRTASIPITTALSLIRQSTTWLFEVGPELERVTTQICEAYRLSSRSAPRRAFSTEMCEILSTIDSALLRRYKVSGFWGRGRKCSPTWSVPQSLSEGALGYSDLLDLHFAVCASVVMLMACLRKGEFFDIADEHVDAGEEWPHLLCGLRKRGVDGVRPTKRKPIPRIALQALQSQIRLRDSWATVLPQVHGGGRHILWRLTESGVSGSTDSAAVYKMFDMLSEFFELRAPNGRIWYLRPHQLRRCFALTFFHSGSIENVLPALSWHMGHRTIAETWRYVREQLTGTEISASEAQLATLAVMSKASTEAVESLRVILRKHFKCDDLLVMDEEEVQQYLEHLHHEGVYTASPVDIRTRAGKRVTILISIKGE